MKKYLFYFLLSLNLIVGSCVDRINFDVEIGSTFPIAVDGHITDEPGPYEIRITKAFDLESKQSLKTPINVRSLLIKDSEGNIEQLARIADGVYQTRADGIRGQVGRAYTIRLELLDGRIYESLPDTMYATGTVNQVYHQFKEEKDMNGASKYSFDVFFNASRASESNAYFLWKFVTTYQVDTNPELFEVSCGEAKCPRPLPCSSYILVNGLLFYAKDCECCTCWVKSFNDLPILSDNRFVSNGVFSNVKAGNVPMNQWTFMHKVHAEVQQFSLSRRAFNFWKAVKDQKESVTSLFQPVSGKIASNFVQVSGESGPIEGLFYASAVSKGSVYIKRNDVKPQSLIPPQNNPFKDACSNLFPYSTTVKPSYWID